MHAEKCPVCNGVGQLPEGYPYSGSVTNATKICHGCNGKGWITVSDIDNIEDIYTIKDGKPMEGKKEVKMGIREKITRICSNLETSGACSVTEKPYNQLDVIREATQQIVDLCKDEVMKCLEESPYSDLYAAIENEVIGETRKNLAKLFEEEGK